MSELWLFAFATLSYLAVMGGALSYFVRLRKSLSPSKLYGRLALIQACEISWMVVAVVASFNAAIANVQLTPVAILYRYLILLIVPILLSTTMLFIWRDVLKDFRSRLKQ